jgi:hypothetical protein
MGISAFGWTNRVTTGALSVVSAAANMGAGNLQDDQCSSDSAWQTPSGTVTGAWLVIDSGSTSSTWRAFGLFRTNLTAAATVRWKVGNTLTTGRVSSPSYDSGTVNAGVAAGYLQSLVIPTADQTGRYCEVQIDDSGNPDGFISVPGVFAGPLFLPAVSAGFASTFGRTDRTDEVVTQGGQEFPINRSISRVQSVALAGVTVAETWASVMELDRIARAGGNVLFAPDVTSTTLAREAVFGRLRNASAVSYPYGSSDRRAWSATVTERL